MKGPLIILSGPSGTGKTSIIRRLLADPGLKLRLSVSATTRPPRDDERDGVDYHFWTRERFESAVRDGEFLEWATVYGNYYGTPRGEVEPYLEQGYGVLLDIDPQGFDQVRALAPVALSVFIEAPSPQEYERRLRTRLTDSEETIRRRLTGARRELERAGDYGHRVINESLETAVSEIRGLVSKQFERGDHA